MVLATRILFSKMASEVDHSAALSDSPVFPVTPSVGGVPYSEFADPRRNIHPRQRPRLLSERRGKSLAQQRFLFRGSVDSRVQVCAVYVCTANSYVRRLSNSYETHSPGSSTFACNPGTRRVDLGSRSTITASSPAISGFRCDSSAVGGV